MEHSSRHHAELAVLEAVPSGLGQPSHGRQTCPPHLAEGRGSAHLSHQNSDTEGVREPWPSVQNVGQEEQARPGPLGRVPLPEQKEVKDTNSEAGGLDSHCSSVTFQRRFLGNLGFRLLICKMEIMIAFTS